MNGPSAPDSFAALVKLYRVVICDNAFPHVAWMLDNMPDENVAPLKFHRWLGFIQGILWENKIYTLDQLREQVRLAMENPAPVTATEPVSGPSDNDKLLELE